MQNTNFVTGGRPMPGRPVISQQGLALLAREGRTTIGVIAGLNALRTNPAFAAKVAAKLGKKAAA